MNFVTEHLIEDKQALKLLFMISLLPDKIPFSELTKFWTLSKETVDIRLEASKLKELNLISYFSTSNDSVIEMPSGIREYADKLGSSIKGKNAYSAGM